MQIKQAEFKTSSPSADKCPAPVFPEYAMIGRSNVGKSSLINMLVNRKGLAKTSGTPGKTQLINHFLINNQWYLVDLPGYGFAQSSKTQRAGWEKMVREYVRKRTSLMTVFVLVDIRIDPQKSDLEFIRWLGEEQVPLAIVFTKSDKLKKSQIIYSVEQFKRALRGDWDELPVMFITSATAKSGRDELLDYIESVNRDFSTQ